MRVADMMAKAIQLSLCPRRRVSERRVGEMPRQARKARIRVIRQPPPVLRGAVIESRRLGGCVRPRAERFGRFQIVSVRATATDTRQRILNWERFPKRHSRESGNPCPASPLIPISETAPTKLGQSQKNCA